MPSGTEAPNCRKAPASTAAGCRENHSDAPAANGEGKRSPPASTVDRTRLARKSSTKTMARASSEGPRCRTGAAVVVSMNRSYHERLFSAMISDMPKGRASHRPRVTPPPRLPGAAWLLAQVGGHAAMKFAERLKAALGL